MTALHKRTARSGFDLRMLRAAVFAAVCVVLAAAGHVFASSATVPPWTLAAGFLAVFAVAAPLAGHERSLPGIAAVLAAGQTVLHTLYGLGQHGGTTMGSAAMASSTGSGTGSSTGSGMASGMVMADASVVERAARLLCGVTAAAISPAQAQQILSDARIDTGTGMAQSMHHPTDAMSATAGASMSVLPSLPMLLCHVLAAVATGWVLRRGDMALLRLIRLSAHGVAEGALVRSLRAALALVRALRTGLPGTPGAAPRTPRPTPLPPRKPPATALQHTVIRRGPPSSTALVLAA